MEIEASETDMEKQQCVRKEKIVVEGILVRDNPRWDKNVLDPVILLSEPFIEPKKNREIENRFYLLLGDVVRVTIERVEEKRERGMI